LGPLNTRHSLFALIALHCCSPSGAYCMSVSIAATLFLSLETLKDFPNLVSPGPEMQECHRYLVSTALLSILNGNPHPPGIMKRPYRARLVVWPEVSRLWPLAPMPPSAMVCPTWRCRQTNFARQKSKRSAHSNTAESVLVLHRPASSRGRSPPKRRSQCSDLAGQ
jgi:hypothetical protein